MKKVLIAAAIVVAGLSLQGCASFTASVTGDVLALQTARCDGGDVEFCWRKAMFMVNAKLRTNEEAAEEFKDTCLRVSKRHALDNSVCEPYADEVLHHTIGRSYYKHGLG